MPRLRNSLKTITKSITKPRTKSRILKGGSAKNSKTRTKSKSPNSPKTVKHLSGNGGYYFNNFL